MLQSFVNNALGAAFCALVFLISPTHSLALPPCTGTWAATGAQKFDVSPAPSSFKAQAGTTLGFTVTDIGEKDDFTNTCTYPCDPPDTEDYYPAFDGSYIGRVGYIWRAVDDAEDTAPDEAFNSGVTNKDIIINYPVPNNAQVGDKIVLLALLGDNRQGGDPRHDEPVQKKRYVIEITDACPDIVVDHIELVEAAYAVVPNGASGISLIHLKAQGDPPVGHDNWNGYSVTEEVSNFVSNVPANWANPILTNQPQILAGSTFVIGEGGVDNQFIDPHLYAGSYTLAAGVNTAFQTNTIDYKCNTSDQDDQNLIGYKRIHTKVVVHAPDDIRVGISEEEN